MKGGRSCRLQVTGYKQLSPLFSLHLTKQFLLKRILCLIAIYISQLPNAHCQSTPYWQQQVNYQIAVTLNDIDHTLEGYIKMEYYNNSPDTLHFIWMHLWPNAYKNDRTAFTEQTLENGSTRFYFSDNEERGYINRLDFKVNGSSAKTEDHPIHQDIIKLLLNHPLAPGSTAKIETPFHVKLPFSFSRGGHVDQAYQITQWYPKPAVYDRKGWHPIPYLDQGEFYSEFGNYQVQITLPQQYRVAATGILQDLEERKALFQKPITATEPLSPKKGLLHIKSKTPTENTTKILHYTQNNVHDFAFFADKNFLVSHDTIKLPSGRIIDAFAFYYPKHAEIWQRSLQFIRHAILTKSNWIGEYPYNVVTVVDDAGKNGGGMEYPTITLLTGSSERDLDLVINHEIGHNWFYGILGTNERTHPWMDEGMNTYYDNRYEEIQYGEQTGGRSLGVPRLLRNKMPSDPAHTLLQTMYGINKDQPIETPSEQFSATNYGLVAYTKTGEWMKLLEETLGKPLFDSCMHQYFIIWQNKHPYPEDFKKVMEQVSGRDLGEVFSLLNKKGALRGKSPKKDFRLSAFFNLRDTDKHNYIFLAPALGYNHYDKQMIGGVIHNYTLPISNFRFIIAPLYGSASQQLNGIGNLSYQRSAGTRGQRVILSLSAESFSKDIYTDSLNKAHYLRFSKFVPSVKYVFAKTSPRSSISKWVQWKTFIIAEQELSFTRDTVRQIDIVAYPTNTRYINQLQFGIENNRVLYPYKGVLQAEQGDGFIRADFTGNYYFNYPKGGGMNVRLFAGKFFYLGDKTFSKQFKTDNYHLNMTGPKGYEDYTYSNYFIGRNEYDRFASQQIMIRDGGFKTRTDLLSNKVGKTDDWLAAANFTSDIPRQINPLSLLPFKLPFKVFFDLGTYAEAWKKNSPTGRFLYDAGFQLSLFKNIVNVYFPLLYSKVYRDYIKSTIPDRLFVKTISFSIDIQNITLKKFFPKSPF